MIETGLNKPTFFYTHPKCFEHKNGEDHPESPGRLVEVVRSLKSANLPNLRYKEAPIGTRDQIIRVHNPYYLNFILSHVPEKGKYFSLDSTGDTAMNYASADAAQLAAGGICDAVDQVTNGNARNAFCAFRPGGHHAEKSQAIGFCIFNTIAIAAEHAHADHGMERVAIVDFDIHHGNGTQNHANDRPYLLYASTHQWPLFPFTGGSDETGNFNNIVNLPMPAGTGSEKYRKHFTEQLLPALIKFKPEIILLSAGFDAHKLDPLGEFNLETEDFTWITEELMKVADICSHGRIISNLEGGYDGKGLAQGVAAHVRTLTDYSSDKTGETFTRSPKTGMLEAA